MESKVRCLQQETKKKDAAYSVLIEKFQEKYQSYTRKDVKEKKINSYSKDGLTNIL